jgi:hypothetical protein
MPRRRTALPIETVSTGMLAREVSVRPPDVVFVKGLIEASDGLAAVFAERGGELTIVAPEGRGAELAEFLADLEVEIGARLGPSVGSAGR